MKRVLTGLMAVLVCGVLVGCGQQSDTASDALDKADIQTDDTSEQVQDSANGQNASTAASNIAVETKVSEDGTVYAFLTNNNEFVVDEVELKVLYRDQNGDIVDVSEDGHDMLLPGSTVVSGVDAPGEYTTIDTEINAELGVNPSYNNHAKNVAVTANKGEDGVVVQIANNSDVTISEIEFIVLMYDGEQIVRGAGPTDICDLEAGQTATEKADAYGMEFDRFEVYLNQAHTFG